MAYQRDARYYRFAQYATAYAFTWAMVEAGVEIEQMLDVNFMANTEWAALTEEYEKTVTDTPDNTRDQMGDLLFQDLMDKFQQFADDVADEVEGEQ